MSVILSQFISSYIFVMVCVTLHEKGLTSDVNVTRNTKKGSQIFLDFCSPIKGNRESHSLQGLFESERHAAYQ